MQTFQAIGNHFTTDVGLTQQGLLHDEILSCPQHLVMGNLWNRGRSNHITMTERILLP